MGIKIRMKDGAVYSAEVDRAKGTYGNPLSQDELEGNFYKCCKAILPDFQILKVKEMLRNLHKVKDVAEIVALLRYPASQNMKGTLKL